MSIHSYVGIHDPAQPDHVRLRYVHTDSYPHRMIPTLCTIWAGAAARDTHRLAALLLEHDWDHLDPDTVDGSTSTPLADERLIAGVGMTLATTGADQALPPAPVTVVTLAASSDLNALWIYLLDPGTDTVTAYTSGDVFDTMPLAS